MLLILPYSVDTSIDLDKQSGSQASILFIQMQTSIQTGLALRALASKKN
jgi:hypothetical protein